MITAKDSLLDNAHGRLKFLRLITGLNRSEISNKYNIPLISLQKWENGTLPISHKVAKKFIDLYKEENIIATEEWLIKNQPPSPQIFSEGNIYQDDNIDPIIEYFQTKFTDCHIYKIQNNEMLPTYKPNDIVIGFTSIDIIKLNDLDCIVTTADTNKIIFRRLMVTEYGIYNLRCLNPLTYIDPILFDVKIKTIAPIRWHRIKE